MPCKTGLCAFRGSRQRFIPASFTLARNQRIEIGVAEACHQVRCLMPRIYAMRMIAIAAARPKAARNAELLHQRKCTRQRLTVPVLSVENVRFQLIKNVSVLALRHDLSLPNGAHCTISFRVFVSCLGNFFAAVFSSLNGMINHDGDTSETQSEYNPQALGGRLKQKATMPSVP